MKLPSGILASCGCSYGQRGPSSLTINGENGYLTIESAYNYEGLRLLGEVDNQHIEESSTGVLPFQFTIEADHFADCIRNNHEPKTPGEEGPQRYARHRSHLQSRRGAYRVTANHPGAPSLSRSSATGAGISPPIQRDLVVCGEHFPAGCCPYAATAVRRIAIKVRSSFGFAPVEKLRHSIDTNAAQSLSALGSSRASCKLARSRSMPYSSPRAFSLSINPSEYKSRTSPSSNVN